MSVKHIFNRKQIFKVKCLQTEASFTASVHFNNYAHICFSQVLVAQTNSNWCKYSNLAILKQLNCIFTTVTLIVLTEWYLGTNTDKMPTQYRDYEKGLKALYNIYCSFKWEIAHKIINVLVVNLRLLNDYHTYYMGNIKKQYLKMNYINVTSTFILVWLDKVTRNSACHLYHYLIHVIGKV